MHEFLEMPGGHSTTVAVLVLMKLAGIEFLYVICLCTVRAYLNERSRVTACLGRLIGCLLGLFAAKVAVELLAEQFCIADKEVLTMIFLVAFAIQAWLTAAVYNSDGDPDNGPTT